MLFTKTEPMANLSQVPNSIAVNTVFKTVDLSIFSFIDGNRVPNLTHVGRLINSLKNDGMKCNPILVNEKLEVIDGQHRLLAAKEVKCEIYFVIIKGGNLNDVHILNVNQKNWTKRDFLNAYADMGLIPYIKLRDFINKNDDISFHDCVSLCANVSTAGSSSAKVGYKNYVPKHTIEEGTWEGRDFVLAQDWANKIRMIKPYYSGYNRSIFIGTLIVLFQNPKFEFNEFFHKVKLQPAALVDCANREQCKILIEEIYNYRNRNKVNLRF